MAEGGASTKHPDKYWADLPADDCAQEMWSRIKSYQDNIKQSTLYPRWVRAFRTRHGLADGNAGDAAYVSRRGSKAHRASVKSSVAAVDARHQLSIVAPAIPALDAIPVNSAYKTLAQVREGKRFFDYYVDRKGLGKLFYRVAEHSQDFGVGWLVSDWDPFGGPPVQPEPQQPGGDAPGGTVRPEQPAPLAPATSAPPPVAPAAGAASATPKPTPGAMDLSVHMPQLADAGAAPPSNEGEEPAEDAAPAPVKTAGELVFAAHTPLTLIEDTAQDAHHDWFMVQDRMNRWDLLARYPGKSVEILNLPNIYDSVQWRGSDFRIDYMPNAQNSDLVAVWTLHHKATRAMPQGRMLRIAAADCWLFDGPYPYSELSRSAMISDPILGTSMGDSTFHHALGLQGALDRTLSATVTNVLALGHQLVSIQDENFELEELSDGVSAIINSPGPGGGPPTGVSLLATQEEHHRTVDKLEQLVHGAMGVNSVIRGDPDTNVKSGSFAGLLVQQAAQYNSPAQFAFQRCVEDVGNCMLMILKRFASQPILGEISGPNGQWRLKQFTQEDFGGIHRLVAKPGNPAEQTAVFKKAKADSLLENGLITSKSEYDAMCETNSSELGTEDEETEELQMLSENEDMQAWADGKPTIGPMRPPPPPPMAPPPPPVASPGPSGPGAGPGEELGASPQMAPPPGPPLPPPGPPPPPIGTDGQPILCPPVLMTDNDAKHIVKHKACADSPAARGNDKLVETLWAHINWHLQNAATKPPILASILGEIPPPPPPGPPAGPPGAPGGGPPHPAAGGKPPPGKGPNGVQAVRSPVPPPEGQPPPNNVAP